LNEHETDPAVVDAVAEVISTLNNIMTGGDLSGADDR
jgi:hypothetical protein